MKRREKPLKEERYLIIYYNIYIYAQRVVDNVDNVDNVDIVDKPNVKI